MRLTPLIALACITCAAFACGIDAVGTGEGLSAIANDDASASASSSGNASSSGSTSDGAIDPTTDANVEATTDGAADAAVDVAPDAPPLVPPYLLLTHATAPASNLTLEGTQEWAYWGVNGSTTSVRNQGASNVISSLGAVGSSFGTGTGYGVLLSWTNGPAGNVTGSSDGFYRITPGGIDSDTASATVRAPSSPVKHVLTVFVGGKNLRGRLTATLLDGSANANDNSYSNLAGTFAARYVVEYATVGATQVEVKWEADVVAATDVELRFAAAALK